MIKYHTRDQKTGTKIDCFNSFEEAENKISEYEEEDKENGEFTENYYEIKTELEFSSEEMRGEREYFWDILKEEYPKINIYATERDVSDKCIDYAIELANCNNHAFSIHDAIDFYIKHYAGGE